jgi:prepilin-type N-terminal cleavage/methylation domain-containing protein
MAGNRKAKSRAFTLVELLVAVAIFSGVVVLTLGAFARSADSSIRSSAVRERTEAARSIVDRIGNDLRYTYTDKPFASGPTECSATGLDAYGLNFNDDCLIVLLRYPGESATRLVLHKYERKSVNGKVSVYLEEADGCRVTNAPVKEIICDPERSGQESDVISDKFIVDDEEPLFSGVSPASAMLGNITALINVSVTVKAVGTGSCTVMPGSCYSINTSFVPNG